jgi:hypothetical protein
VLRDVVQDAHVDHEGHDAARVLLALRQVVLALCQLIAYTEKWTWTQSEKP